MGQLLLQQTSQGRQMKHDDTDTFAVIHPAAHKSLCNNHWVENN